MVLCTCSVRITVSLVVVLYYFVCNGTVHSGGVINTFIDPCSHVHVVVPYVVFCVTQSIV